MEGTYFLRTGCVKYHMGPYEPFFTIHLSRLLVNCFICLCMQYKIICLCFFLMLGYFWNYFENLPLHICWPKFSGNLAKICLVVWSLELEICKIRHFILAIILINKMWIKQIITFVENELLYTQYCRIHYRTILNNFFLTSLHLFFVNILCLWVFGEIVSKGLIFKNFKIISRVHLLAQNTCSVQIWLTDSVVLVNMDVQLHYQTKSLFYGLRRTQNKYFHQKQLIIYYCITRSQL